MLDFYTFVIPISEKMCPGGENPCSGYGECDKSKGICSCEVGRHGSDCSSETVSHLIEN